MSDNEGRDREPVEVGEGVNEQTASVDETMRRMSRRSFLWAGATVAAGYAGWRWLTTRSSSDAILWPLRRGLEFDERVSRSIFSSSRLAATFPVSDAGDPRPNGDIGLSDELDENAWRLSLEGAAGGKRDFTLADIKALPRYEIVTELKCIEGWSQVVHWAGARLADLLVKYPPDVHAAKRMEYVGLATPDAQYYVGLDMDSATHVQTLLCYEMNGRPLTAEHGAPLRLAIPVKYGIKNLKRIGVIRYAADRPADYWAEQGYDWYAGH